MGIKTCLPIRFVTQENMWAWPVLFKETVLHIQYEQPSSLSSSSAFLLSSPPLHSRNVLSREIDDGRNEILSDQNTAD